MIVEDEFLLLLDLESILLEAGVGRVHSCRTLSEAQDCLDRHEISLAFLDFRIGNELVTPVARRLARGGIPFAFHTGQMEAEIAVGEWPRAMVIPKPAHRNAILAVLRQLAANAPFSSEDCRMTG